ncbi:unnamed protein product [Bodo saltans]|uniref:Uncharacterized protein n=1 Tax=Bodo saltans TaxID=75058 RepID=A0A0S4JXR3_BODSA|nr:unnamed protein product [Bodo saltans]|eukprot:CUG94217.1 unnamed protein product [Bodo saltans]
MAKKHREKRQKYVELLREKAKERDAYLEKRNRKRTRDEDEGEANQSTSGRVDENTADLKKRRVDPSVAPATAIAAEVKNTGDAETTNETPASAKKKAHGKKKY